MGLSNDKGIIPIVGIIPLISRGDRIRTCDHLVPNQARYRAALHPEYVPLLLLRMQRYAFFLYPASFSYHNSLFNTICPHKLRFM